MWRLLLGTMGVKSLVQGLNAAATAGFEPRTVWSEVRRRNRLATVPPFSVFVPFAGWAACSGQLAELLCSEWTWVVSVLLTEYTIEHSRLHQYTTTVHCSKNRVGSIQTTPVIPYTLSCAHPHLVRSVLQEFTHTQHCWSHETHTTQISDKTTHNTNEFCRWKEIFLTNVLKPKSMQNPGEVQAQTIRHRIA